MKQGKIISIAAILVVLFYSCNKQKLDQPVYGLLDASELANKKGVENLLIGAYAMLDGFGSSVKGLGAWESAGSNWIYGSICGSEAYKGSFQADQELITFIETFSANAGSEYFSSKWGAVYEGVQRANTVLKVMRQATDILPADTAEIAAEARFLRAHYLFDAQKMWNRIPYVDEHVSYDSGNYHIKNDTCWSHIEDDLVYAMNNLNIIQAPQIGRANKYAAEALLAKAYMFQKKFLQAQPLLLDLINNGVTSNGDKYALVHFSDNFNAATKNNPESVFAFQSSVNDGGFGNGNFGDVLNFPQPYNGDPSSITGCCGFFAPSQYLVNHYKTDSVTGLPDPDHYNDIPLKNDDGLQSSDPFIPYTGTLDPRLDRTVGRRGLPYLDWGINPGFNWIRDQNFQGPYLAMKNVFYKSQQGTVTADGWNQLTAININFIRYSDILLWAAEAEIENGSLDQAQIYVNQVRTRAADSTDWVKSEAGGQDFGGYAANYFIRNYPSGYFTAQGKDKALRLVQYERMLELAMEGHRFFDLVRWGIADPEINAYFAKEQTYRSYFNGHSFTPNKNEFFPIPQTEIDLSAGSDHVPMMTQNPGY